LEEIRDCLAGSNMVFLAAGMGGGTGTGAAPVIATAAREMGILTVGVVTKPFHFESGRGMRVAEAGIAELREAVDTLIIIPNQNLFRVANERTTFTSAFGMADQVLCSGISCITDLMVKEGLVNLDFADVCSIMSEMGTAMIGAGEAAGERRAPRAAEAAIANPLFDDASLKGARGVLISITGGKDLTLYEVDEAASRIRQEVDEEANIIVGAIIDPALEQAMRVSVVATGIDQSANRRVDPQSFAELVLPPNVAPASLDRTAGSPVSTVESRPPIAAVTEFETPALLAPVIPFPEPTDRRQTLDEETHFDPPAIRRLLDRFAVAASERRQARRASA
jgi:cell division protein FtsZ